METKKSGIAPRSRLETGTVILAAAELVDTNLIKPRLTRFIDAHRSFIGAQRKVEVLEAELRDIQAQLALLDAEQDEAVENLARALVFEGQPRTNPFAAFGADSPSVVKKLTYAEEATVIHQLAATVQRAKAVTQASRDAAQAAERAAQAVQAALAPAEKLEAALSKARHKREAVGERWDAALAALKTGARFAADEGAPQLYGTLFGRLGRPTRRNGKAKAAPAPTPPDKPAAAA
jgi:hypothetical protein